LIGVKTLKLFVDNKIKTYVHCKLGHGRSPTLIDGYFILEGDSYMAAIKKIRNKREIHMSRVQISFLKKFEFLLEIYDLFLLMNDCII
jgi:protein-tyrosine phosphatase